MNVTGDTVVTEFIARGTHRGELMGISPTNRKVAVPVCNITEFRDGKVYAEREYYDTIYMMQQLGVEVGHAHA
jgi:predicted ester cyclase